MLILPLQKIPEIEVRLLTRVLIVIYEMDAGDCMRKMVAVLVSHLLLVREVPVILIDFGVD